MNKEYKLKVFCVQGSCTDHLLNFCAGYKGGKWIVPKIWRLVNVDKLEIKAWFSSDFCGLSGWVKDCIVTGIVVACRLAFLACSSCTSGDCSLSNVFWGSGGVLVGCMALWVMAFQGDNSLVIPATWASLYGADGEEAGLQKSYENPLCCYCN